MKNLNAFSSVVFALLLVLSFSAQATDQARFPSGPNQQMTPGTLCQHPDSYRYPEHVPYCSRDVDGGLKREIIRDYDQQLGYVIQSMPRQDFKIDHLVPLCAGGGNDEDNLWPQHKSIYAITDPMEPLICEKMAEGKLKQRDAVEMIKAGKLDLSKVKSIMARLNSL